MPSLNYMVLSFFKEKKISYFLDKDKRIIFKCPNCKKHEAIMHPENTVWICSGCNFIGTLKFLIEKQIWKNETNFYNPKKQKLIIDRKFKSLTKKYGIPIKELHQLAMELIDYYENEKSAQ